MHDHERKSDNPPNRDPWDPDFYETGSTRPPKSHGGTIAVILVTAIFLCGMVSTLSLLNLALPHRELADGAYAALLHRAK